MTRRGLIAALLLAHLGGCATPTRQSAAPGRIQRHQADQRCRDDRILVEQPRGDSGPPASVLAWSPPAVAPPKFPDQTIATARRFTVAIRSVRTDNPATGGPTLGASSQAPAPPGRSLVEGSGVVIRRDGLILTNDHVVHGSDSLRAWADGRGWMQAEVVSEDPLNDLAVISVRTQMDYVARLTRAGIDNAGQSVLALGFTPGEVLEQGPAALPGRLISAHRSLQNALDPTHAHYYGDMLESSVPLKAGHSGGPLLNADGQVIGINTAAVTHRLSGRRKGYAIPMSGYIREVVSQLAQGNPVRHGYLGVSVCTCGMHRSGAAVKAVAPNSPAARAGLRAGDTILRLDRASVRNAAHLAELVRGSSLGRPLPLVAQRNARTVQTTVTLTARP